MHCRSLPSFPRTDLKLKKTVLSGTQAGDRMKRDCPLFEHGAVGTRPEKDPKLWVILEVGVLPIWQSICLKLGISSPEQKRFVARAEFSTKYRQNLESTYALVNLCFIFIGTGKILRGACCLTTSWKSLWSDGLRGQPSTRESCLFRFFLCSVKHLLNV